MKLKSEKPIREFKFNLTYRLTKGEEIQHQLTEAEDDVMENLLGQLDQFMRTEDTVCRITIDVGDRQDRRASKQDIVSSPGMNTLSDIKGPVT